MIGDKIGARKRKLLRVPFTKPSSLNRYRPPRSRPAARSLRVAYRQDLEGDVARRAVPDDLVADPGADQRLGERRDPGDAAVLGIRLVLADDGELALFALVVGD